MTGRTLDQWLSYIDGVHRVGIDLGLERIGRVAARMGFRAPAHRVAPQSVIVAGTNGKGSTCVALEALLAAAGLRVGTTLSPHLHVFNERVRICGEPAGDDMLCSAFARVDRARGEIPLTYFEFSALVAMDCFRAADVDVAVLEVGLGGRLDAFNLVTADVAVITSIALDHQAFLGDDLESIGREKAGVMRPGQRVVLGADVTESVVETARRLGCAHGRLGIDFHVDMQAGHWNFVGGTRSWRGLPLGSLAPANCALALEAASHLVTPEPELVAPALAAAALPGRMEAWRVGRTPDRLLLLDVAHNPAGARFLGEQLDRRYPGRSFVAVLGMLEDKDSAGVVGALEGLVRHWVCVPTHGARGLSAPLLGQRVKNAGTSAGCVTAGDAPQGLRRALSLCEAGDGILAFGSFDLVEHMREALLAGHEAASVLIGGSMDFHH